MSIAQRLPILWLTVRQFRAGKSTIVVALFAATPILFAVIDVAGSNHAAGRHFLSDAFLQLLAPTVIPLATLILATNVLGNEIADRTLPYLFLKPLSRGRIVLEKYLGAVFLTGIAFAIGLIAAWAIVDVSRPSDVTSTMLAALLIGAACAILAYGALFLLVSLVIPRALIVGIIYILLWESALARFIPGVKLLSIRHFSQSVFVRILGDSTVKLANAMQLSSALIVVAILTVVSLVLATMRLRTMNLN